MGGCVGEGNARAGREDLGHRFEAAWVRVRAARLRRVVCVHPRDDFGRPRKKYYRK